MTYFKLNLGCGKFPLKGFVNIDIFSYKYIDLIADFNNNLPFKDNIFNEVYCSHVIEHLDDILKIMQEIFRISKNNAIVIIKVPHFTAFNALSDLTHKRVFGWKTFDVLEQLKDKYNIDAKFFVVRKRINFSRGKFLSIFNPVMNLFINNILLFKFNFYERFFCYILPSEEIIYRLKVIK